MKTRCKEEVSPVLTIFEVELGGLCNRDFEDDAECLVRPIPTYYSCKLFLYRSRLKTSLKHPTSQSDIERNGDDMCDRLDMALVFATDANLKRP